MRDIIDGLARWPLLMGAVILYGVAVWEETKTGDAANIVAFGAAAVGSVLLGAWVWSMAIDGERKHHRSKREDGDGS